MPKILAVPHVRPLTRPMNKHHFYRYCRFVHGWLSAFAFVALCFFSFTGLLLNHPEWFSGSAPNVIKQNFTLSQSEIQQVRAATQPSRALVTLAASRSSLQGELKEGDADENVVGNELFVRMQGVRGTSFLRADLASGALEVTIETPSALSMLNELHRAERAGKSWRLTVDVIAIVLMALSLVGYLIFLSMYGTRLRTAILLTMGSALGMGLIFVFAVS
jgi:uncharacterized protein